MKYAFCVAEDFNLGAGYIITYLKSQGHEVKLFFDPRQFSRSYSHNKLLAKIFSVEDYNLCKIKEYKPDVCLFTCITATYQWALSMARKVKAQVNCKIIFGGIHPTLVPDEVKRNDFIDDVIIGDGIEYFGGKFEPDKYFPEREAFYKELPPIHRKHPIFMASFGCALNCSFCGNEQLRKTKHYKFFQRSVEGCLKELLQIKAMGAKYIIFVDDIFTLNHNWVDSFLPVYKEKIGLPFCCFGHPKYLKEDIVKNLKDAGCHTIWMGIQTGAEYLRKSVLSRAETNDEIMQAAKYIKQYNIKLIIDHIFGIPQESSMAQDMSYNLYWNVNPDIVNCYQLLYFPKAKIIEEALRTGYLSLQDIAKIERGEGFNYQMSSRPQFYRDTYIKSMTAIPLRSVIWELAPLWLCKLIIYFKAGRGFIVWVMLQNEIFFTIQAVRKQWILRISYIKKSILRLLKRQ